ncbi:MAG: NADH-quinone oxidoreductase subunit C [Myxococcales bacterium]|nr:NADH-quinone oxidoreductase subunit C [Myxococcales bacterium]
MSARRDQIRKDLPTAVLAHWEDHGAETLAVDPEQIVPLTRYLRDRSEPRFELLIDLTAIDYPERAERFELVYRLRALSRGERLCLTCAVPERPGEIDSISAVFPAADWLEREVFDLYGVRFLGHPNLRRILLDESFRGHPLRKDYAKTRRQLVRPGA